jgi:hypothetical protein
MGLSFVRGRKAVTAMRATESGRPDSWDANPNTQGSPSNQELMDRKKPFRPTGSEPVNSTTSNYEERKAPQGNEYRLQRGDD